MSKTRILCSSLRPIEFLRRISNETAPSSLPFRHLPVEITPPRSLTTLHECVRWCDGSIMRCLGGVFAMDDVRALCDATLRWDAMDLRQSASSAGNPAMSAMSSVSICVICGRPLRWNYLRFLRAMVRRSYPASSIQRRTQKSPGFRPGSIVFCDELLRKRSSRR